MPTIDAVGARIWYETSSDEGPAVLLVHGMSGTHEIWRHQVAALRAGGYRVVRLDRRGAGRSTCSQPPAGSHAEDLLALLDALGLRRAHVVGHALGASDAMELAVHHSERLLSLTVSNGHAGVVDGPTPTWRSRIWAPEIMSLPGALRELSPSYRALDPTGVQDWVDIAAHAQPENLGIPSRKPVAVQDLRGLRLPSLFIAGDADLLTPPVLVRELAAEVPRSRLEVVPDSGHATPWERPDDWNRIVLAFLDGCNRAGPARSPCDATVSDGPAPPREPPPSRSPRPTGRPGRRRRSG